MAHIGDSRIYHIRPNTGIMYQSSDHSLVNDLLRAGELTEKEAINFPQKNIITRAMQPNLERRHKADVYSFNDIQKGDYFFLCSDGVLEQLTNDKLCEILATSNLSDCQKLNAIKNICDGKTKDNYTCYLIPVDDVVVENEDTQVNNGDIIVGVELNEENDIAISEVPTSSNKNKISTQTRLSHHNKWLLLLTALLLIVGSCTAFFYFSQEKEDSSHEGDSTKLVTILKEVTPKMSNDSLSKDTSKLKDILEDVRTIDSADN